MTVPIKTPTKTKERLLMHLDNALGNARGRAHGVAVGSMLKAKAMSWIMAGCVVALCATASYPAIAASAQSSMLAPNHPSRYVVQVGDTLWGIAAKFLRDPGLWQAVWRANPQIRNPHLIYPGDEVRLTYLDGRPMLEVRRRVASGVIRLSPKVRIEQLDQAIPTIPVKAINPFLESSRIIGELEYDDAPYIVSVGRERLVASPGTKIYVRSVPNARDTAFVILRKGKPYINGDGEVLGYEALHVGNAALDIAGDPATLVLTQARREVLEGDRLFRLRLNEFDRNFIPTIPPRRLDGEIISVVDGVTQIGQYQTVVLDKGATDGVQVGHVFDVFTPGETIEDERAIEPLIKRYPKIPPRPHRAELDPRKQTASAILTDMDRVVRRIDRPVRREAVWAIEHFEDKPTVRLPDEKAGTLLVFRTFDRVSYAIVMEASTAMHVNDLVRPPQVAPN